MIKDMRLYGIMQVFGRTAAGCDLRWDNSDKSPFDHRRGAKARRKKKDFKLRLCAANRRFDVPLCDDIFIWRFFVRGEFRALCEEAYEANMEIQRQRLAIYTWGNVSAFDSTRGIFAIKPSGVEYDKLSPDMMVVVDLDGNVVEGGLKPSSDTKTHLVLYREFQGIKGITHTHSTYAVAWAQAKKCVPVFGTTHADHGVTEIPCTEFMSPQAVKNDYELETGNLIVETLKSGSLNPAHSNMILVAGHGPFTWGESAAKAVYNSAVLEEICKMAFLTLALDPLAKPLPEHIIKKHYERKHGSNAYYGQ